MSFYDDASLVVIPSGYKTSKVYAEKPTDGSGDLTFTRTGDTATRVNSAGLIEEVRTNLVLQSNTFSTTWINSDSTETGGQAGYDGTNNAWLLTSTILGGFIYQSVSISGQTTFSVYAKAGSQNGIILYSVHTTQGRNFNLSTGAVGGAFVAAPDSSQIQSVGNGWYRCSITISSSSTNNFRIYVGDGSSTALGNVVIQNSQCEKGDIATSYIPTTTAAVSVGPTANTARLDYLGSTCPRLILEGQRSNLVTFSEQLNNAAWGKTNITISANNATSPDGYQNADTCLADGVNAVHIIASNLISFTSGTAYSFSVFAKKGTNNFMQLIISSTVGGMFANFDLNNGTVGTLGTLTGTTPTSSIVDYGNGWYRCIMNFTPTLSTSAYVNFVIVTSASAARAEANTLSTSVILWGAQVEAGAYATSIIPTLAASATRGKDNCIKTSASALIGQTEGTVFVEFKMNGQDLSEDIYSNNKNLTGSISIQLGTNGQMAGYICYNGSFTSLLSSTGAIQLGQTYKIALAYKTGNSALYINGTQVATNTTAFAFTTTLSEIDIANNIVFFANLNNKNINQVLQFKTRLTNAELATLTTL